MNYYFLFIGIDVIQPSDDQFSFIHTKIFSLHNHLHVNPYSTKKAYFVDKKWIINKVSMNELNQLNSIDEVGKIPNNNTPLKGRYNMTLSFPSSNLAITTDGTGSLHFFRISTKESGDEEWQFLSSINLGKCFLISDSKFEADDKTLHIVLLYAEEKPNKSEETIKSGLFHTVLEWITLNEDESNCWVQKSQRKLTMDGSVDYAALESDCKAIYIVTEKVPKWTFDSINPIVEDEKKEEKDEEAKKVYFWTQTGEEINVSIPLSEDVVKSDLNILVENLRIEVKCKNNIILSGNFFQRIDKDLTSWSFEKNKLEIQLIKHENGLMWKALIENDETGEEIINPEIVQEVHERLAHLCSDKEADDAQQTFNSQQLEECDTAASDSILVRIDRDSHKITHEISLSSLQWLFKVNCDPKETPALCLRLDVDACVWQFKKLEDKAWPYKHVGTFFAFGYVQASKTQKKFMACPPNLSYVAICETSHHIYLYRQPSAVNGELRNRLSGKKVETVAKQQLINLDTSEQIFGVYSTNEALFVLTENFIHLLVINE